MNDPQNPQLNELTGSVSAVLFRNEENGYTVLHLDTQDKGEITVVGCMPGITLGETVELRGTWTRHPNYGEQFKAETIARRMPVGTRAVFEYLASGVLRGVGEVTARRIVDRFGTDALSIIEQEPEKLTVLPGMTPKRARALQRQFHDQMGMRLLLDFLSEHSLPLQAAMPLYRRYGNKTLTVIRESPYLLANPDFGIDFSTADALALELGLEGDDPQRIEAAILFELNHNAGNGHSFIPYIKLVSATASLLNLEDQDPVQDGLDALIDRSEIIREEIAHVDACYLSELYFAECHVAQRLDEMCQLELTPPQGLDQLIDRLEQEQGIRYAQQQRHAVELAASRQVILLTGGPGTGKTTCLRAVLALFNILGLNTALAAPTGRAAKRLSEACSAQARTIHRLLETQLDPATGKLVFTRNEYDPLKTDAVIVDETSMVDITLMSALLSALRGDCRLVLVGDPDQLPSVGPGNLLGDLLRSGTVPAIRLTEIFRQAQESAIVMNAHTVNQGMVPNLLANQKDFFFLRRYDSTRTTDTIVELCKTRLPQKMGIPFQQIQVLTPTRKRGGGTATLNRAIQAAVNPPAPDKGERTFGSYIFRLGDRVMQIRNNYDALWQNPTTGEQEMGIFNGDIGTITAVNQGDAALVVNFDGRLVEYTADMLNELEPAYAVTVHKAQGSEYRAVILAVSDVPNGLLTRGVLYTAITRARELLIIVGDDQAVERMVHNNKQTRRYSGLRARLQKN